MQTIPQAKSARNPRSVNDRRSHQTARPGWRPRRRSPGALAADIAASIKARIAEERGWSLAEYGIADKPEMIELVIHQLQ
ncbi:hypothetical protein C2W62_32175 [Candidatus Entotheonella serta]|nr:hypothetical protein C2W62_32175 [Candidatus Entotheonella serta]